VLQCSEGDSGDAEMVDEEHIGVNAIMGNKKRKKSDGAAADKADKADKPKVNNQLVARRSCWLVAPLRAVTASCCN